MKFAYRLEPNVGRAEMEETGLVKGDENVKI